MTTPSSASAKPRALLLAVDAPYPVVGGGPLRCASILDYLAQHFSVHLILFHQPGAPDPARAIPAGRVEKLDLIALPYHSKRQIPRLIRTAWRLARNRPPLFDRFSGFEAEVRSLVSGQNYDVAVLEHFWSAPYVEQVRACAKQVVLDLHNIESAWHSSMAASESPIPAAGFRRFAKACVPLEQHWLPRMDNLLVASCDDAKLVRALAPETGVTIYPNALPELVLPARVRKHEIVFSGNLEYPPNVGAVRFFLRRMWPELRTRWPELNWKIVGRYPQAIRSLVSGDPRILVTGPVDDAIPILAESQVAVVPLLAGSGTRFKILEAWAGGTPVVSTSLGAEGLEYRDQEHLLLADEPRAFAEAVSRLLASPDERSRIGMAGRRQYEERYCWPAAWKELDIVLGQPSGTSRSAP